MVALSALAIGGLGMSSAAAAFAASRRQSIAILKLVGAPRRTIHAMLLIELGLIAGLAILAGLAVGRGSAVVLVAKLAGPLLPVDPRPQPAMGRARQAALFGIADQLRRQLARDRRGERYAPGAIAAWRGRWRASEDQRASL